jgi:hypothetical protein
MTTIDCCFVKPRRIHLERSMLTIRVSTLVNVNIHTADMFEQSESVVNALRSLYFKMPANRSLSNMFFENQF